MKIAMTVLCLHDEYKPPERAHWFDAGLDCYSAICKVLKPGEIARIPLGFSLEIPHGHVILLTPRSSLNLTGIDVKLGTIDADYTGEICAVVENHSKTSFDIDFETKLCQLIMLPIHEIEPIDVVKFDKYSKRNANGFGSTDKKR